MNCKMSFYLLSLTTNEDKKPCNHFETSLIQVRVPSSYGFYESLATEPLHTRSQRQAIKNLDSSKKQICYYSKRSL